MKITKYHYMTAIAGIGLALLGLLQIRTTAHSEKDAVLSINTEKTAYALGELINLTARLENPTAEAVQIVKPSVLTGTVRVFVSKDGQNYTEYVGPNWGSLDTRPRKHSLESGRAVESKATILFNRRFPSDHLTPMYAERIKRERLDTEFAMLEPGRHWLKATYANGKDVYRSDPIEIEITQPVGTDAVVWEQIKTDGAFAYLLQTGQVKYRPGSEEAREFSEKLQRIVSDYAGTELTQKLEQNLDKYNRNVEYVQRLKAERESAK